MRYINFDPDLPMAFKLSTLDLYYCKKLGNLFTIWGILGLFFNWEGVCIQSKIWPTKIPARCENYLLYRVSSYNSFIRLPQAPR